jgi:MFS family permease
LPEVAGLLLFSFSRSPLLMCITGILWLAPFTAWTIATSTWSKDLYPEDKRGQFAGYYLVFWVMIPMVLGPQIGSWLVSTYGIPTMFNGIPGYIPTPIIFQGAALLTPLAALPLLLTKKTV